MPLKAADAKADGRTFDALLMSDYIHRGVSLSQRKPSAGSAVEATWQKFYVGGTACARDCAAPPFSPR